jgi:hypothetical protein
MVQLLPSDIGSKVKAMDVHEKANLITNKKDNSDVLSAPKKSYGHGLIIQLIFKYKTRRYSFVLVVPSLEHMSSLLQHFQQNVAQNIQFFADIEMYKIISANLDQNNKLQMKARYLVISCC